MRKLPLNRACIRGRVLFLVNLLKSQLHLWLTVPRRYSSISHNKCMFLVYVSLLSFKKNKTTFMLLLHVCIGFVLFGWLSTGMLLFLHVLLPIKHVQANLDISNSDISNSAKLEAYI